MIIYKEVLNFGLLKYFVDEVLVLYCEGIFYIEHPRHGMPRMDGLRLCLWILEYYISL